MKMKLPQGISKLFTVPRTPKTWGAWLGVSITVMVLGSLASLLFWDWCSAFSGWLSSAWDWLNNNESPSATIRNIGLVLAGLIALPLAIWRAVVADKQASAAQRQADLDRESLLNESYQKGAEMLGSNVLAVRMGGIYALRQLAQDHAEIYHLQVMSLFCAFIRRPLIDPEAAAPAGDGRPVLRQDVQAVVDAIAARTSSRRTLERKAGYTLDLRGSNLAGAQMEKGMNLFGRRIEMVPMLLFEPGTKLDFEYAAIDLSHAQLEGANLTYASMNGADLSDARLYNADLSNASLINANLSGVHFIETNLSGAWLQGADLSNATFSTIGRTNLSGAKMCFDVPGVDPRPIKGLTQDMLDLTIADPNNPPELGGVVLDVATGKPLVWRGGMRSESH